MASDWRVKYLDLLDEQEKQLEQWTKMESVLRYGLSRVSLFADGLSPELDDSLNQMRELIRAKGQGVALAPMIEQLADHLSRFEASDAGKLTTSSQVLGYLTDNIAWPKSQSDLVKELRSLLSTHSHVEALPIILESFSKLCVSSFYQGTTENKKGLFGKLFTKKNPPQDGKVAAEKVVHQVLENIIKLFRQCEMKESMLAELAACQDDDELLDISLRIVSLADEQFSPVVEGAASSTNYFPTANELFIALLDRMSLPGDLEQQSRLLKERLSEPLTKEQWPGLMDKICDLIAIMRLKVQQEKQDIERFLSSLTDSLKELDDRVQGASHDQKTQRQSGHELNTVVQAQMSGLASSVEQAMNFDVLKQAVHDRIEQIRHHMESYQIEEEERFRSAEEHMRILNERLHHLEKESSKLKARVREQRNQALRDTLTGISNRLAYDERIETEYSRWKRFRIPVSLMVWDVDHFKNINDSFGHQAGDKVLIAIARMLASQIRESDFLARYGGEEFVLIASGANCEEALNLAEKLRCKVESSQFRHGDKLVPVTVSCGIVEFKDGYTIEQLFEAADKALYKAKLQGRNLCSCASLDAK